MGQEARQAFLRDLDLSLAANEIRPIAVGNSSLLVVREASAGFDFEFDDNGKNFAEGGYTINTGESKFGKITVYNRSATEALKVSLRVGKGTKDAGVQYDYLRQRGVTLVNTPLTLLAAGVSSAVFSGINAGRRRRNYIVASIGASTIQMYLSTTNSLAGAGYFFPIYGGTIVQIESDEDFYIVNDALSSGIGAYTVAQYFFR